MFIKQPDIIYLSLREVIRKSKQFTDALKENKPILVSSKNEPLFYILSMEEADRQLLRR